MMSRDELSEGDNDLLPVVCLGLERGLITDPVIEKIGPQADFVGFPVARTRSFSPL